MHGNSSVCSDIEHWSRNIWKNDIVHQGNRCWNIVMTKEAYNGPLHSSLSSVEHIVDKRAVFQISSANPPVVVVGFSHFRPHNAEMSSPQGI